MTPKRQKTEKPDAGTKASVLAQVENVLDHPNIKFPISFDPMQKIPQSKLYADGGRKVAVLAALAHRAETARFPQTAEDVHLSLTEMLRFCIEYQLAPTLGIFAIWNGVTMQRVWQIENEDSPRSRAVSVCKETIRSIIEQATVEGDFNPLIFFNMMKSQYGLAENVAVTVKHEDNATEITEDEYAERVVQLTEGADGVFRP